MNIRIFQKLKQRTFSYQIQRHFMAILVVFLVGNVAAVENIGSTEVKVENQKAKWQIVNYWSKWCGPCRVEIPELNLLSKELKSFNVDVVGVNFDEDSRATTIKIAQRMGIEFPTLTASEVSDLSLTAPNVLPTTYILSPDKKVLAKLVGAQDRASLKAKLAELKFVP